MACKGVYLGYKLLKAATLTPKMMQIGTYTGVGICWDTMINTLTSANFEGEGEEILASSPII